MSHAGMAGPRWGRGLTRFQNIVAEGEVDPAATVRKGWRPPHDQPWRPPYRRQQLRRHGRRPKGHRGVARAQRQRLHLAQLPQFGG
jgi:hypothetical protein